MSTGHKAVLCGLEDNRRSGIALATFHRIWYTHFLAQLPKEGRWYYGTLNFLQLSSWGPIYKTNLRKNPKFSIGFS